MKQSLFKGVCTALVTPFKDDLTVDYKALGRLIDYQLKNNVDALLVFGTTGESSTLSDDEKMSILEFTVERTQGKVPIIAGTGSNNTAHAVSLSKQAQNKGARAVLIVTPYYNKTSQNGLFEHFKAISNEINIPIMVYNVPARTGMTVEPETYLKLSELKNVEYVKEASTDIEMIKKSIQLTKGKLDFFCGNDDMTVDVMKLGAFGVVSVTSNLVPKRFEKLTKLCLGGGFESAEPELQNMLPLIKTMFIDINPIPIKYALSLVGICNASLRLPLVETNDKNKKVIENQLKIN